MTEERALTDQEKLSYLKNKEEKRFKNKTKQNLGDQWDYKQSVLYILKTRRKREKMGQNFKICRLKISQI